MCLTVCNMNLKGNLYMKCKWIIPTLSRARQVQELLNALSILDPSAGGIVVVNGHSHIKEYQEIIQPKNWEILFLSDNLGALGALNYVVKMYPNEEYYGFIGDDEFTETKDWSKKLIEAASKTGLSNGNDNWQSSRRVQGYVCISGDLVRELGYMAVPDCWHWYGFDGMWEYISSLRPIRTFVRDVIVDHRHHLTYKSKKDECYDLGNSRIEQDRIVFENWKLNYEDN